ncbi:hypothetical protein J6590_087712 [Homalodisca vitripennis]|nr:hypothetical protein J6590_087712 [Homalodisca vitripennis]
MSYTFVLGPRHTCPHRARHVSRPIVGRHTVKELQRSIQPVSSDMSAPTPDLSGRTVPAPSPICGV